jgi:hypothetical protein
MDARDEQEQLWFDDDATPTKGRASTRRRVGIASVCLVCVAAVSVPVALTLSSGGAAPTLPHVAQKQTPTHLPQGKAQQQVLAALSATTSSGSFNVSYEFDPATPPTETTTTTTSQCTSVGESGVAVSSGGTVSNSSGVVMVSPPTGSGVECVGSGEGASPNLMITGQGTIDTDPFAMVATSDVPGFGTITLRDDGTDIWELGGGDYGLSPGSTDDGPGQSLSGFAGLVEGTLGQRQGALAMGGLSSPTGYLDLDQSMITGADQIGTGTVDGTAVTIYQLSISAAQEANVPRETAEESTAVTAANAILAAQGYTGTTVQVSIDASGFIRQTQSVAHFSDGSTSTSESTFSDFGCAGTVLMPGQTGATEPPAGCVSPDTGVAPTTTTTAPPSSTTSTAPPASTTTTTTSASEPPASTTTTTTSSPSSSTTTSLG